MGMSPAEGTAGQARCLQRKPGGAGVFGNGISLLCVCQGQAPGAQGTSQGFPGAEINLGCGIG